MCVHYFLYSFDYCFSEQFSRRYIFSSIRHYLKFRRSSILMSTNIMDITLALLHFKATCCSQGSGSKDCSTCPTCFNLTISFTYSYIKNISIIQILFKLLSQSILCLTIFNIFIYCYSCDCFYIIDETCFFYFPIYFA